MPWVVKRTYPNRPDEIVSKVYPTKAQATVEAFERGFVIRYRHRHALATGYSIVEISEAEAIDAPDVAPIKLIGDGIDE